MRRRELTFKILYPITRRLVKHGWSRWIPQPIWNVMCGFRWNRKRLSQRYQR